MKPNEAQAVESGKVVSLHYTLRNDAGDVLDSSEDAEPLHYLHGHDNIVPGLENALTGKNPGDQLHVSVSPQDGYGERVGPGPQPVSREAFPEHLDIQPGMQFLTQGPEGEPIPVWVTGVEGDTVFLDANHPLAGETLHFDVTVVSMRDATEEELMHGHPHGADGHSGHDDEDDFEDYEDEDEDEDMDEDLEDDEK